MFDLADFIFMPDALPDPTPKGFISPPGLEPGIFHFLGECVNYEQ